MNELSNINFGQDRSSAGWDWLTVIQGITKFGLVHSFCTPLYISCPIEPLPLWLWEAGRKDKRTFPTTKSLTRFHPESDARRWIKGTLWIGYIRIVTLEEETQTTYRTAWGTALIDVVGRKNGWTFNWISVLGIQHSHMTSEFQPTSGFLSLSSTSPPMAEWPTYHCWYYKWIPHPAVPTTECGPDKAQLDMNTAPHHSKEGR